MKIPLSNRLLTCCDFVQQGDCVADIGCDHGYLGIYLLKNGLASRVIAADVNEAPLLCAVNNAAKYDVCDRMSFYLSNGVQNIPRDFNCMVCAGMGADTMISILDSAPWLKNKQYRLILQCQSKRPELRKYLYRQGYHISREELAQDGKFYYTVMEVVYGSVLSPAPEDYYITPALRNSGSPLLPAFRSRVVSGLRKSLIGLSRSDETLYVQLQQIITRLENASEEE